MALLVLRLRSAAKSHHYEEVTVKVRRITELLLSVKEIKFTCTQDSIYLAAAACLY